MPRFRISRQDPPGARVTALVVAITIPKATRERIFKKRRAG
jgi:hypothetical protein